ncbi:MAG: hypothetical protein U0790_27270 [Isosphaeraceae bacterium]
MDTLKLTTWGRGRDPSECGIAIDGHRITAEDLETVTTRGEAEGLGIPGVLFDRWQAEQPSWLFHWWLEEQAKPRKRGAR